MCKQKCLIRQSKARAGGAAWRAWRRASFDRGKCMDLLGGEGEKVYENFYRFLPTYSKKSIRHRVYAGFPFLRTPINFWRNIGRYLLSGRGRQKSRKLIELCFSYSRGANWKEREKKKEKKGRKKSFDSLHSDTHTKLFLTRRFWFSKKWFLADTSNNPMFYISQNCRSVVPISEGRRGKVPLLWK